MKMLLRAEFPNGHFGDPALYVWEVYHPRALLFDCGDLSQFTTRQLLRVSHIFLSHCHMDHFFDFDLYLRVHIGSEKFTTIFGPPETSLRVAGKLQGYTWNLIYDQNVGFKVIDLDFQKGKQRITYFHAKNHFMPSRLSEESWDSHTAILDTGGYRVKTTLLDHRTPSLAYAIEEKLTFSIDAQAIQDLGLEPGPWINQVKKSYIDSQTPLENKMNNIQVSFKIPTIKGNYKSLELSKLKPIFIPRQRHKIVYATDGAANLENRKSLLDLVWEADVLYCETCFLRSDELLAQKTKHFTASFIGQLAQQAKVKKLVPFHFSKRYLAHPHLVLDELSAFYKGELVALI